MKRSQRKKVNKKVAKNGGAVEPSHPTTTHNRRGQGQHTTCHTLNRSHTLDCPARYRDTTIHPAPTKPISELRPTLLELETLPDAQLVKLVSDTWDGWVRSPKSLEFADVEKSDAGPIFQFEQPVKLFQILNPNSPNADKAGRIMDARKIYYSKGDRASSYGFCCVNYGIPMIFELRKGMRYWIFIKNTSNVTLETIISRIGKQPHKQHCLLGSVILVSPENLKRNGIEFEATIQKPGQIIYTTPGVYFGWINLDVENIVFSCHFFTEQWLMYTVNREPLRCKCLETYTLDLERMCEYHYRDKPLVLPPGSVVKADAVEEDEDYSESENSDNPNDQEEDEQGQTSVEDVNGAEGQQLDFGAIGQDGVVPFDLPDLEGPFVIEEGSNGGWKTVAVGFASAPREFF